jgi:hypothetical protein
MDWKFTVTGGEEFIAALDRVAAKSRDAYLALTRGWVNWMHDPFWWKLALSGTPTLCALALSLDAAAEEVARDPVAHNRRVYAEMTAAVAALGDPATVFENVIKFAVSDATTEAMLEQVTLPPPLAWTLDDGESVRPVIAECFRCGEPTPCDTDIGAPCQREGCEGRYIRCS